MKKVICICGGGNGSHVAAAYLALKNSWTVHVLTRQPQLWLQGQKDNGGLLLHARKNGESKTRVQVARIDKVSSDPEEVAKGADYFLLGGPSHANPFLLQKIAPFVKPTAWVGALYGQGGFDWAARYFLSPQLFRDGVVFGLQNIPWICKATSYGREATIIGPKTILPVVSVDQKRKEEVSKFVYDLFDIPTVSIPNFLCLTLTPSNQIIHPGRYYGIFKDWDGKKVYSEKEIPLLYEDMDEFSAQQMQDLNDELQLIKTELMRRYPGLDLTSVKDLGPRIVEQYGSEVTDTSSLRSIFATNRGYSTVKTPVKTVVVDGQVKGYQPNFETRFFTEDIPFGLCILKSLAELLNINTPRIDFFIRWAQKNMGEEYLLPNGRLNEKYFATSGVPYRYGIRTADELVKDYL